MCFIGRISSELEEKISNYILHKVKCFCIVKLYPQIFITILQISFNIYFALQVLRIWQIEMSIMSPEHYFKSLNHHKFKAVQ